MDGTGAIPRVKRAAPALEYVLIGFDQFSAREVAQTCRTNGCAGVVPILPNHVDFPVAGNEPLQANAAPNFVVLQRSLVDFGHLLSLAP